jgi:hypothetical protein
MIGSHVYKSHLKRLAELEFIEAIDKAAIKFFIASDGEAPAIEYMDIGNRFLAYLKGEAVFHRIDAHGTRYEPPTCGTGHLIAERVLRIVENGVRLGDAVPSDDALTQLEHLADRAGVHFARTAITVQDEVPF